MDKGLMFMGIGFELVIMCLGGAYLGNKIDEIMGWPSLATAGTIILFMIVWFVHLIYLLRRFEKDDVDPPAQP